MKSIRLFLSVIAAFFVLSAANTYKPAITMQEAVDKGDKKAVAYYINQKEDVNQKDDNKVPLIVLAAQNGNADIVKALIKAGADVNIKDDRRKTALYNAIDRENEEIAEILKAAGAK